MIISQIVTLSTDFVGSIPTGYLFHGEKMYYPGYEFSDLPDWFLWSLDVDGSIFFYASDFEVENGTNN